jgi:hypothetical protein
METQITTQELKDRLTLIESMIAEGRRNTESWGWMFVLWGLVYYLAIAWSTWRHNAWAWPVTILLGVIVAAVVVSLKAGNHPGTTLARAIGSIWIALGVSMCVLFPALGLSGRLADQHVFVAAISAMLGMANGASSMILRWKLQFACAVVWWLTAVMACFTTDTQSTIVFLVAIFLCQIVFGIYGVIAETQQRKRRGPVHA